ncbi:MAG: ThiF family adenylyltransferase, partial [Candidatus Omnitrophica bacterium]|nr:ThiF family adenylyltransferase [Candidatus Omnitrophota bacterium]
MAENTFYDKMVERNIGMVTESEQKKLKDSCVAIFGAGGLGGVAAEVICRSGVGRIKIIDFSEFEPSNLNRQIFCFRSTIGQRKIDATENFLKDINPDLKLDKYPHDNERTMGDILKGVDVVILAVDKARACILISREARERNIPLVEAWAVPFFMVRVYTKNTISMEEAYDLPSKGKKLEDLTEKDLNKIRVGMLMSLQSMEGTQKFYTEEVISRIMRNENSTFAPFVWQNAVDMSLEAIKVLLGWGQIALAPKFALYDPLERRIPRQFVQK